MERSARQYSILGDRGLFNAYEQAHHDFVDTVKRMQALTVPREQVRALSELAQAEGVIFENVTALRYEPKRLTTVVEHYQVLGSLARSLDNTGAAIVNREVGGMQALSGDVHAFIYWQLVALVPVALFLVIGATILILKPIRQIEGALQRLGDGDFTHPVSVSGPRDLEALGRQLDWVRLRLIELEEQKTRFMRQVSHELKTPLSAIREGAELLGDGSVGLLSQDQLEVARTAEDLPHRASVLAGYDLPFFRKSHGVAKAILGGWQAQLIAIFQSGWQLSGVDAYWTGADPFLSGDKVPDGNYFNACSLNTQGVRQNCANATQPAVWIQRPADTLRVAGSRPLPGSLKDYVEFLLYGRLVVDPCEAISCREIRERVGGPGIADVAQLDE
jgi:hypothetical protein